MCPVNSDTLLLNEKTNSLFTTLPVSIHLRLSKILVSSSQTAWNIPTFIIVCKG